MATRVGAVTLKNPVMTASGTCGLGVELGSYMPLGELGAVVIKSLAAFDWAGNPKPRLHPTASGMLNAVGLQGPGVEQWIARDLPQLIDAGATVVCSIWGFGVQDYVDAAQMLAPVKDKIAALEINLSCPNMKAAVVGENKPHAMFAHDADLAAQIVGAAQVSGLPLWAKLSPNTDRIGDVAEACMNAGAQALTLVNTALGMIIDTSTGRPALGNGGGGLSGRGIHPIAVRAVSDIHSRMPGVPIVGVGGVTNGLEALELMLAGASAVQVGTASFAEPRATYRIAGELCRWAERHKISDWSEVIGLSHRGGFRGSSK
jgi:dihydroorotate dehydrogenase (NAD+) catalytic subunit